MQAISLGQETARDNGSRRRTSRCAEPVLCRPAVAPFTTGSFVDAHQSAGLGVSVTLVADKAYDVPHLRKWLWGKHIGVRIARKGVESSERLGRRRWVIERTMSWLTGYRRLNHRYERHPRNYLAFLGLAAALCCYKRLARLTT